MKSFFQFTMLEDVKLSKKKNEDEQKLSKKEPKEKWFEKKMKKHSEEKNNEKENKKDDEKDDEKDEPVSDDFLDNIDKGPKAIVSVADHEKDSKKRMRYIYGFGSGEKLQQPYEVTFLSGEFEDAQWNVDFTKGLEKVKSEKNMTKFKKCIEGLEKSSEMFVGGDMNNEIDSLEQLKYIHISIPYEGDKQRKIVDKFANDSNNFSELKSRWKVKIRDSNFEYNVLATRQ